MTIRNLFLAAALPAALALVGCGPAGSTGGTKSTTTDARGSEVKVDETVGINIPISLPHTLKQGETKKYELSLKRGKDLKSDVDVSAEAPDKLKAELDPKKVPASGEGKFTITVTAEKDAPIAEHVIKLTAKTDKGEPAMADFKVKVEK